MAGIYGAFASKTTALPPPGIGNRWQTDGQRWHVVAQSGLLGSACDGTETPSFAKVNLGFFSFLPQKSQLHFDNLGSFDLQRKMPFVRPHSALNGLTSAQVAGLNLSKQRKREFLLVA